MKLMRFGYQSEVVRGDFMCFEVALRSFWGDFDVEVRWFEVVLS